MRYPDFDGSQACASVGTEHFYLESSSVPASNAAKAVCKGCHYMVPCLEWALIHESYGIWGGTTSDDRRAIRRQMNIIVDDPIKTVSPSDRERGVDLSASTQSRTRSNGQVA